MISEKYCSLLDREEASVPEGRYKLAKVSGPISKKIALPLESRRIFSGEKSDLMMEAVPYLVGELLEMILKEDDNNISNLMLLVLKVFLIFSYVSYVDA